jgi:hypothetical protein
MTKGNQSATASYPPWDIMRNATEKALRANPRAQTALNRLTTRGIGREQLLDGLILMQIAKRMETHPPTARGSRTTQRGTPQGMTWGQFSRLSEQLQKMATAVDTVNRSPYYNPSTWFYRPCIPRQSSGRVCRQDEFGFRFGSRGANLERL